MKIAATYVLCMTEETQKHLETLATEDGHVTEESLIVRYIEDGVKWDSDHPEIEIKVTRIM